MGVDDPRPLAFAMAIMAVNLVGAARAGVSTDGTVGPRLELTGPEFAIAPELGTRAGPNLFHSFEKFSLAAGERATFSGPGNIQRIISRVTGGARSDIDGAIRSTIAGADFYFINPAGVIFGPDASLDVQGSFHVSTADELRFTDGTTFSATTPSASFFSVARPEAFGFLGAGPASLIVDHSTLAVPTGATLSLVGGAVALEHGVVRAEAGTVQVAAIGGAGAVGLADAEITGDHLAEVALRDHALVDAAGDGGGRVLIRGGRLVVAQQSLVAADNLGGPGPGGELDVRADSVDVSAGSGLSAAGFNSGNAGVVTVQAGTVDLRAGGFVQTSTFGQGDAGTATVIADRALTIDGAGADDLTGIFSQAGVGSTGRGGSAEVRAGRVTIADGGQISSSTSAEGHAGNVTVTTERLLIDGRGNFAGIFSDAAQSIGNAGMVEVAAPGGEIELVDGGLISSRTLAEGDAGTVTVTAGRLLIDGAGASGLTGITTRAEEGSAGIGGTAQVDVAGTLAILNEGQISSSTAAEGNAGEVDVTADHLRIDGGGTFAGIFSDATASTGNAGIVEVAARGIVLVDGGLISSRTLAEGDAGTVTVTAGQLLIDGAGASRLTGITSRAEEGSVGIGGSARVEVTGTLAIVNEGQISSSTTAQGHAGEVVVTADRLRIDGGGTFAGIFSDATASTGDAGVVIVAARDIVLADGGLISSRSSAKGDAGTVRVTADRLLIDGAGAPDLTGIASRAEQGSTGAAGSVIVAADQVRLINRGQIQSSNQGIGAAGDVRVRASDRLLLSNGAGISTDSVAAGGGEIRLLVGDALVLRDSNVTTSVQAGTDSTAGNIFVDPRVLVIDRGRIQANAGAGSGGNVIIVADSILVPGGDFEALLEHGDISATGGDPTRNGTIAVSAPDVDLTSHLVVLEPAIIDTAPLRARCGARRDIGASSFTGVGRAGLPPDPDGPLASGHASGQPGSRLALRAGDERARPGRAVEPGVAIVGPCPGDL